MNSYLSVSKKYAEVLKALYTSEKATIHLDYSFEDMMQTNETRLSFLNDLFVQIEKNNLSDECLTLFAKNIEFLYDFINGKFDYEIAVPERFYEDMSDCKIIPTQEDIKYLFELIKQNVEVFSEIYEGRYFSIDLPDQSFNMNMTRNFEIKRKNIAHLLGLTEGKDKSNLLRAYFIKKVPNSEKYGGAYSERLLNWLLSEDGQSEILYLNQLTLDFVAKDKKTHPNSYDETGSIKDIEKFRKRFKKEYEELDLDFPIIKFSRYVVKSINCLNFLNLSNTTQIILDYNAPTHPNNVHKKVEKDEKDLFFINLSPQRLLVSTNYYENAKERVRKLLLLYKDGNQETKKRIERELEKYNLNKSEKTTFLNLIQTYDFVGKHGIKPHEQSQIRAIDKIHEFLAKQFKRDIHLIGFATEFAKSENDEIIITSIYEKTTNNAHCDTSIAINISELIDKYYKRGRAFFLDKIVDSDGDFLRLSNPTEEEQLKDLPNASLTAGHAREQFNENARNYEFSILKQSAWLSKQKISDHLKDKAVEEIEYDGEELDYDLAAKLNYDNIELADNSDDEFDAGKWKSR